MAFCKFCGREIPDGALCSCPGAQNAAQAQGAVQEQVNNVQNQIDNAQNQFNNNVQGQFENAQNQFNNAQPQFGGQQPQFNNNGQPQFGGQPNYGQPAPAGNAVGGEFGKKVDGLAGEVSDKLPGNMKGNKNIVYIACAAVLALILIIVLACVAGNAGYKGATKKYFKSISTKKGGKTYYTMMYPEAAIKELKDDDKWDELIEDYNDNMEDKIDDWDKKPKFRKITRAKKMKNSELKSAESYFYRLAISQGADIDEDDIDATKGYIVTFRYKDEDGDNAKDSIYLVKLKGDGWKVMGY